MNIFFHFNKNISQPTAVAIGTFDGIHLGHQAIINKLISISLSNNLSPSIVFFEPSPKEFFLGEHAPARIYDLRNKIINIKNTGIKNIFCQKFNQKFANISAKDFIANYLVKKLNAKYIIIGDDFKFGKDREGSYKLLKHLSKKYNFKIDRISTLNLNNQRVSSSQIRNAVKNHDLSKTKMLLGKPLSVNSKVIYGQKNGRRLGFRTANQKLLKNSVLKGVYLTKIYIDNASYFGVSNAGTRPTINGKDKLLETHIFDFNQTIYKKHITIEVLKFIRAEKKFDCVENLKKQIAQDIQVAKNLINKL